MDTNIHEIIDYFARANVTFAGAFLEDRKLNGGNMKINRRTNPFCGGLVIPVIGSACLSLNGSSYDIQPGIVVHAGPGMHLKIDVKDTPWRMAVLHYKLPETEQKIFPLFNSHYSFHISENVKILNLFQQLYQIQSSPGATAKFHGKRLLMEFLGELFDSSEKYLADDKTAVIEMVLEYIRQNYAEGLNINQVAAHFKMNRRKLAPLFKRHVGMTPSDYLIECRILKAKELLYVCDYSIKQVSECVGYSDSLFFSRAFKKKTGVSPSQYRESKKNT